MLAKTHGSFCQMTNCKHLMQVLSGAPPTGRRCNCRDSPPGVVLKPFQPTPFSLLTPPQLSPPARASRPVPGMDDVTLEKQKQPSDLWPVHPESFHSSLLSEVYRKGDCGSRPDSSQEFNCQVCNIHICFITQMASDVSQKNLPSPSFVSFRQLISLCSVRAKTHLVLISVFFSP